MSGAREQYWISYEPRGWEFGRVLEDHGQGRARTRKGGRGGNRGRGGVRTGLSLGRTFFLSYGRFCFSFRSFTRSLLSSFFFLGTGQAGAGGVATGHRRTVRGRGGR